MNIQKIGTYFFIVGVLIAILSGAFPISGDMQTIALLMLIITGAFVGLLNIEEEREMHFLIAAGVFIIASRAIDDYLVGLELLKNFNDMLSNLIIFAGAAGVVVGLKLIFHYASYKEEDEEESIEHEFENPYTESVWNAIIFVAVCLAFVIFILEVFFYTNGLTPVLEYISYVILAVFAIDLVILITKAKGFFSFFRHHWADIVSIIPVTGVFQLLKVVRIMRLARLTKVMQSSSKLARMSKITHSTKFFSKKSGFNKYLKKKE